MELYRHYTIAISSNYISLGGTKVNEWTGNDLGGQRFEPGTSRVKDPERQSLDRGVAVFYALTSARTWSEREYKLQHRAHKAKE
jgi:hypothetical protein